MNLVQKIYAASDFGFNFLKPSDDSSMNVNELANNIIDIILLVAGILAIVYLIWSGILYLTAAGNPDAAKKGQQGIINAVIGIVIILLAYVIARAVSNSVGTMVR